MNSAPLLRAENLRVHLPIRTGGLPRPQTAALKTVDDISFTPTTGETLAVGESACDKSPLARALLRRMGPPSGRILRRPSNAPSPPRPSDQESHGCAPQGPEAPGMNSRASLLQVEALRVHFPTRTGGLPRPQTTALKAVDGISFDLAKGERQAIVGESGCDKSTLARALLRRIAPTWGRILQRGEDLAAQAMRQRRCDLQNPLAAPRKGRRAAA